MRAMGSRGGAGGGLTSAFILPLPACFLGQVRHLGAELVGEPGGKSVLLRVGHCGQHPQVSVWGEAKAVRPKAFPHSSPAHAPGLGLALTLSK